MDLPHDQGDELQAIWKDHSAPKPEDSAMMLELVREKGRTLYEFLHGEDKTNYIVSLLWVLPALLVWRTRTVPLLLLGHLILTVTLLAIGAVTWINARRAKVILENDREVRGYQQNLLQLIDMRIRFVRSIKYWFGVPFLFGLSLVGYSIAHRFLTRSWSILAIVAFCLAFETFIWHGYDVKFAGDLRRRKDNILNLLRDMDEAG